MPTKVKGSSVSPARRRLTPRSATLTKPKRNQIEANRRRHPKGQIEQKERHGDRERRPPTHQQRHRSIRRVRGDREDAAGKERRTPPKRQKETVERHKDRRRQRGRHKKRARERETQESGSRRNRGRKRETYRDRERKRETYRDRERDSRLLFMVFNTLRADEYVLGLDVSMQHSMLVKERKAVQRLKQKHITQLAKAYMQPSS